MDVGKVTSFTLTNAVAGQAYYFAVAAYFPGPVLGVPSEEVTTATNLAPSLVAPGDRQSAVGVSASLQLVGSDPDGDALSYSTSGLPPGLNLDTRLGVVFGSATTAGAYSVKATVSDGKLSASQSFKWTVGSSTPTGPTTTPMAPSGALTTNPPPYYGWLAVSGATSYRLWVDDAASGTTAVLKDFTPSEVRCSAGTGLCAVVDSTVLAPGNAVWYVMVSTSSGNGPWSAGKTFTVPGSSASTAEVTSSSSTATSPSSTGPTATLMTPSGALTTNPPPYYGWLAVPGATSYRLWVDDAASGTTAVMKDFTPSEVRCSAGTGLCAAVDSTILKPGNAVWYVMVTTSSGNGPWSIGKTFSVPDRTAPVVAITSPSLTGSASTTKTSLAVSGMATDNVGVTKVTWVNSLGGSGTATGTTSWSASISLVKGKNVVTVTAYDSAGNTKTATITITRS